MKNIGHFWRVFFFNCGHGSVLFWRWGNTLCTFVFWMTLSFYIIVPVEQNQTPCYVLLSSPGGGTSQQPCHQQVRQWCYVQLSAPGCGTGGRQSLMSMIAFYFGWLLIVALISALDFCRCMHTGYIPCCSASSALLCTALVWFSIYDTIQ